MTPTVQPLDIFFADLLQSVRTAKSRVWIQVMLFEAGMHTRQLVDALIKRKKEGNIDIRLTFDWVSNRHTNGELNLSPFLGSKTKLQTKQEKEQTKILIQKLQTAGIQVNIVNLPLPVHHFIPFIGRNHCKFYIVDDVAWIGGMNLGIHCLSFLDTMVKFTEKKFVQKIVRLYEINPTVKQDIVLPINKHFTGFIDAGNHGKSIILQQALAMINQAKNEILFVSQLVPDNSMLSALIKKAKEGVTVTVITSNKNHPLFTQMPQKIFFLQYQQRIKNLPNFTTIHLSKRVHAKYIGVDNKMCMFGSHNFVEVSTYLGTKEVAIQAQDAKLTKAFTRFFETQKTTNGF